jgi:hydroxyacylglutathione hydrolase
MAMFVKQLYTGCLSEAAYYIESNGEAAIIDPLRDIDVYLTLAKERGAVIKYIFETHFHADFVSGHLELNQKTGAPIVYGPGTETSFEAYVAKDGEQFNIGNLTIEVLHTPGHTLESSCYLLKDEQDKPYCVFTGDTLFVGDVGRPDLSSGNLTSNELAGMLYDSLNQKIKPLNDEVLVYPAHGPGSACGKNLGPDTYSTIGDEKKSNYALQAANKEEFIKAVTEGLNEPPVYFYINAKINKEGYDVLDQILKQGMNPLPAEEFNLAIKDNEDIIVLDTRNAAVFTQGFVPGSVFIGLDGRYAEWAGSLLPYDKDLLLVTEPGKEEESIIRLARVGLDKVKGYLHGGYAAWKAAGLPIDMIIDIEADELAMDLPYDDHLVVVDVRKETEFADGHVKGAFNLPLGDMKDPGSMSQLEETDNIYVHCAGGYRSVIAASLLKRQGFNNLRNVLGGWGKIKQEKGIEVVKEKSVLN